MKVSALVPWAGSKRTIAARIDAAIGDHRVFFDPFCGSMAPLLAKRRATIETVNDLHGDATNIARVIQHPRLGPKLYRQLRRTLFCQEFFTEVQAQFRAEGLRFAKTFDSPDLERAVKFSIYSWFGRNGVIGTNGGNNFCVRYTGNGGSPSTRWRSFVSSIPAFHRRLQGVIILREDGFNILERVEDAAGVAIYCDPPYLQKSFLYEYDFAPQDHVRLAEVLNRFKKTRVALSYYDHPDLAHLYPGWQKIHIDMTKAMVSQGQRGKSGKAVKAPEVLLVNGNGSGPIESLEIESLEPESTCLFS